jgi:L-ascorbate metabolism protein UlaG (beta-lactamase superfamily)
MTSEQDREQPAAALTWVGHSTVLIELDGARILTDPVLRGRIGPLRRTVPVPAAGVASDLDAVLLSHLHADHLDLPSLRLLPAQTAVIAPVGSGAWLSRQGIANVQEIGAGGQLPVGPVTVGATAARHGSKRRPGGPRASAVGFVLSAGSGSVYFAGDTDLFDEMSDLAGSVDVALLPVWGWGPTLGPGHLDPARAATAAQRIAPRLAIPIHWGTYAAPRPFRGGGDPQAPPVAFARHLAGLAPEIEARILQPGERTNLG